jgi:hypothetical protein
MPFTGDFGRLEAGICIKQSTVAQNQRLCSLHWKCTETVFILVINFFCLYFTTLSVAMIHRLVVGLMNGAFEKI